MTKYFLLMSCLLMATASALAQQFPMDPFMGVNLRREDPIERLKCVGFVREYHDWAVDESNAYNFRRADSLKYPYNRYSWNSRQSTSVKFDDFYQEILRNLPSVSRPPICATMKQCLPYLAGGDTYGTYSELKPVPYHQSGRAKPVGGFPQTNTRLDYIPITSWNTPASYSWIADWLYQFTRRYGANRTPSPNVPKLKLGERDTIGANQVGYIELWNEPNKYWIRNDNSVSDSLESSWLRATKFTGAEYAAMASATYDGHKGLMIDSTEFGVRYTPGTRSADPTMKFVMGGSAGIREYDWRFLQDMKNWFDTARANASKKYPFDVINFHHYNSSQWFGIGGSGTESLKDYAASPEEDRWQLGSRNVNYSNATTTTGFEKETSIPNYTGEVDTNTTLRTFKQRLIDLRYRVDSLFGNPLTPLELWMSEFGFDTNEKSPYKVPSIQQNNRFADQQEVQARFIVRTYLEIASARWDRAMQYDFRDEKSYDGSLFQASGLLKDRENNYAPKKSYYYVYTMKEALKGTKFTKEIKVDGDPTFVTTGRFQGHSYWYKDAKYPRISRFAVTNPNATRLGDIVLIVNNTQIRDATNGVTIKTGVNQTSFDFTNTVFEENLTGLITELGGAIHPSSSIVGTIFDGNYRDLKQNSSNLKGIKMTLLENSTIARNHIKGIINDPNDYRNSATNVGILSINSRNTIVSCNFIDSARIGMQFKFNNTFGPYGLYGNAGLGSLGAGNLGGDTLSKYAIGLKVDSFAAIGIQNHRRNVWISPLQNQYQADALLEDPTPARIAYNRFGVETAFKPSQVSPMAEWFRDDNNPPSASIFNCGQIPGIRSNTGGDMGVYEDVIAGNYQGPEAYLWMLEKQAFEEFSELPANVQTAAMQSFLNSKQGTEIETFYQLKKGFEVLFQQDATRAERLKQLNQFMDDWATKKQFVDNQWITEDASIQDWSQEYMELSSLEKQSSLVKATALQQLNATLPNDGFIIRSKTVSTSALRPYIVYEKVVNDLYLSKIIAGTVVYTEKEAELLKKIAMMCPLIAAEAPMKARVIYQHFVNPAALPEADCSKVPNVKPKKIEKPTFTVYPLLLFIFI